MKQILGVLCVLGIAFSLGACRGQADRDSDRAMSETERMRGGASGDDLAGAMDQNDGQKEGAMTRQQSGSASLSVADQPPYGAYLADGEGRSLYLFASDEQGGSSSCEDACARAWPPLTAEPGQTANAGPGVDASLIGSVERPDGTEQVTYNGYPLYYFARDAAPGDTQGQGVNGFGADWYLVSPDGDAIDREGAAEREMDGFQQGVKQINEDGSDM